MVALLRNCSVSRRHALRLPLQVNSDKPEAADALFPRSKGMVSTGRSRMAHTVAADARTLRLPCELRNGSLNRQIAEWPAPDGVARGVPATLRLPFGRR